MPKFQLCGCESGRMEHAPPVPLEVTHKAMREVVKGVVMVVKGVVIMKKSYRARLQSEPPYVQIASSTAVFSAFSWMPTQV